MFVHAPPSARTKLPSRLPVAGSNVSTRESARFCLRPRSRYASAASVPVSFTAAMTPSPGSGLPDGDSVLQPPLARQTFTLSPLESIFGAPTAGWTAGCTPPSVGGVITLHLREARSSPKHAGRSSSWHICSASPSTWSNTRSLVGDRHGPAFAGAEPATRLTATSAPRTASFTVAPPRPVPRLGRVVLEALRLSVLLEPRVVPGLLPRRLRVVVRQRGLLRADQREQVDRVSRR